MEVNELTGVGRDGLERGFHEFKGILPHLECNRDKREHCNTGIGQKQDELQSKERPLAWGVVNCD